MDVYKKTNIERITRTIRVPFGFAGFACAVFRANPFTHKFQLWQWHKCMNMLTNLTLISCLETASFWRIDEHSMQKLNEEHIENIHTHQHTHTQVLAAESSNIKYEREYLMRFVFSLKIMINNVQCSLQIPKVLVLDEREKERLRTDNGHRTKYTYINEPTNAR